MKAAPLIFAVGIGLVSALAVNKLIASQPKVNSQSPKTNIQQSQIKTTDNQKVKVNIKDTPFLGDKSKTSVAIVEFSDYECPYCRVFMDESYDKVISDLVNTGKAIFVYKDFPLSFHDPAATDDSMAASCAREQKGNEAYFALGKLIYAKTSGGGSGVAVTEMLKLVESIGLDNTKFRECMDSGKFRDQIKKDLEEGQKIGVSGTPTFIIGKINGDEIEGTVMVGAQPYDALKAALDQVQ